MLSALTSEEVATSTRHPFAYSYTLPTLSHHLLACWAQLCISGDNNCLRIRGRSAYCVLSVDIGLGLARTLWWRRERRVDDKFQ